MQQSSRSRRFVSGFWVRQFAVTLVVVFAGCQAGAAESGDGQFIRNFLSQHCIRCHGAEASEADLMLDALPDAGTAQSFSVMRRVAEMVDAGDMPPEGEPRPGEQEVNELLDAVARALKRQKRLGGATRRMNRFEYENTVHDLLQIETPLSDLLPEDSQVQGFDNVADGLGLSSVLIGRYLEAADVAFDSTIRRIKPLPIETRRSVLIEQKENASSISKAKGGVVQSAGAMVDFTPGWPPARVDDCHPIEAGVYRCRVAVWPYYPNRHRTLTVGIFAGPLFGSGKRKLMGVYDVTGTPDAPRVIEFTTRMEQGDSLHVLPWVFPQHVTWRDGKDESRPGVAIAWAETHGPLDQAFPSDAQIELFGERESISMAEGDSVYLRRRPRTRLHHVQSSQPKADAERIIRDFVNRAFRRPVPPTLADDFVGLTLERLANGRSFEDSVRAGVTAALCSPHFLLLNGSDIVDDYSIASRLSYFLWSSMPDQQLLDLAAAGELSDPQVRYREVERMIEDPKFQRFVDSFTGQWLDLRQLEFTTPDAKLYPEYDELLLRSMSEETRRFFHHIIKQDLSVMNFVDSDFAILNQRMATHYFIRGVRGHEDFQLMDLPADSIRGGILTHASVLKVTANGTNTSPVIRGAWVLDKLLGQPPLPPPPGVSAIEPDTRGATTIGQQLELHRQSESCNRCHRRIDPPGFALEEFDVIGGHRQRYRTLGKAGIPVLKTNYRLAAPVEISGRTAEGTAFANFDEFRDLLKAHPEAIARAMAINLLVYGTGRPVTIADREDVRHVVDATRKGGFGLRSMIHAIVETELFLSP